MKYDCNKTLDYAHEKKRMCKFYYNEKTNSKSCYKCSLQKTHCHDVSHLSQKHIDIVQKWSDEHPEKTRKEAFREIFPHIRNFDPQSICFKNLIGFDFGSIEMECAEIGCTDCWKEPYAGEFEKAREEE